MSGKSITYIIKKYYIWNLAACSCENGKYLASIIDHSVITCDEIIEEETKTVTKNFNEKNGICKTKNLFILRAFLSITIAFMIYVSVCCYLINYKVKQNQLLPFYVTNNELKEVLY